MGRYVKTPLKGALMLFALWCATVLPSFAAPYAAMVMDARTGEVLHSRNADTRLHPASLTKMMTLYIAFEAVERGEIGLDSMVTIPRQAANEPPSKLGLRAGQRIKFRYLIRAAAIKSANDAATAIGFAIEGSEARFARRMNRTARALGMTRTTFRNAHGLTQEGHLSTARDMTILGRHLIYDYPEYYNLFSRTSADAGIRQVPNTNRRLLAAYRGADGIKTGYTRAAGYNLVASAERGSERIIATMFGGTSTAQRNGRVAELLDMGFSRAPTRVAFSRPEMPRYEGSASRPTAEPEAPRVNRPSTTTGAKSIRISGVVSSTVRPQLRPRAEVPLIADADAVNSALAEAIQVASAQPLVTAAPSSTAVPPSRPASLVPFTSEMPTEAEVVTRVSTSGNRHWGINVGRFTTKNRAERALIRIALNEMETLDGSLRRVVSSPRGHDANFMGLTRETADLACRRLQARGTSCFMISP